MHSARSESDVTSLAPSSPRTSVLYYVQSPSFDGGDKLSFHAISPMESPSHPSVGRHSRNSSSTRFSGIFRSLSGRRVIGGGGAGIARKAPSEKGWPECNVIVEEGNYDEYNDDHSKKLTRWCQAVMALSTFLCLFAVFCLIIWGAARPYKVDVVVRSFSVTNMYMGSGSDSTGVPTKMFNINGTLHFHVINPATFFGIHVTSTPVHLKYSDVIVATGQLTKYFQPRKSQRSVAVHMEGTRVPLYGAGYNLEFEEANGDDVRVPLTLEMEIRSTGEVVGKLVTTKHVEKVMCKFVVDSRRNHPIRFRAKDSCTYN